MKSVQYLARCSFAFILFALAIGGLWSCSDTSTNPPDAVPPAGQSGLIVSEARPAPAQSLGAVAAASSADEVSYVSLPPGTVPNTKSTQIRNVTVGGAVVAKVDVVDGGFDPVPVAASAGDELEFAFTSGSGQVTLVLTRVPAKRPPIIVRTSPPKGRTDVALRVRPAVVFSEPVDANAAAGAMRLTLGGATVAARVEVMAGAPWIVEVVPAEPLRPLTTYELVISQNVRDRAGDALENATTVMFTTGPLLALAGRIAFVSTREGAPVIYTANADGSAVTRLTNGEKPAWSPDGQRIAFQRGGTGNGVFPQGAAVFLINADGSGETRLIEGLYPAWSADGKQIVFGDSGGIAVINLDGSGFKRLIRHDVLLDQSPGYYVGAAAWSPDGSQIAFEHGFSDGMPQRVYVMKADGSEPRLLTNTPFGMSAECYPAWSPVGSKVMIWSFSLGVAVADLTGTTIPVPIPATFYDLHCGSNPDWSPDGATIALTLFLPDATSVRRGRIHVVSSTGGLAHLLIPEIVSPANPSYSDQDVAWARR